MLIQRNFKLIFRRQEGPGELLLCVWRGFAGRLPRGAVALSAETPGGPSAPSFPGLPSLPLAPRGWTAGAAAARVEGGPARTPVESCPRAPCAQEWGAPATSSQSLPGSPSMKLLTERTTGDAGQPGKKKNVLPGSEIIGGER